ncbi:MAG: 30S ribosomal protein S21 [Anaerolineales bacterium]|nr:30S ribosomal protein S21 [Anaerolineales bacterium]
MTIKPSESPEELLRRFRKKVMRSGRLAAVRQKRWFISKSEVRRIEKKKAIRRIRRRQHTRR